MVEGARLESVCRGNSTVGSNPTLSAIPSHSLRSGGSTALQARPAAPSAAGLGSNPTPSPPLRIRCGLAARRRLDPPGQEVVEPEVGLLEFVEDVFDDGRRLERL